MGGQKYLSARGQRAVRRAVHEARQRESEKARERALDRVLPEDEAIASVCITALVFSESFTSGPVSGAG